MELDFVKLHGLGNDFVFIDNLSSDIEISADEAQAICDRHFGIGADGVILVSPSPREECVAYMHYINSDGTLAQMCGNGVRCFAKYLVDRGFVDESSGHLVADTLAGPRPITFETSEDGMMTLATVDMGEPILNPACVPISLDANSETSWGERYVADATIPSPWGDFEFTAVSMGNPHAICFIKNFDALPDDIFLDPSSKSLDTLNVDLIGSYYESDPVFPEKSNIEFAHASDSGIDMRVYERGCAETLACGTGACATSVAATLTGRTDCENIIHLKGGDLGIRWADDGHVYMTGPAEESFVGRIELS